MYWQGQHVQSEGADEDWGTMTVAQAPPCPPSISGYMQAYDCVCMCISYSTEYSKTPHIT